jgi:hypothetical protein
MAPTPSPRSSGYSRCKEAFFAWWQTLGQAIHPCRLSLFVALVGGAVILLVPQRAEALAAICDDGHPLVFASTTVIWGWTSWYMARTMLRFSYPDAREIRNRPLYLFVARWFPRLLGIAPIVCIAIALFRCPAQPGRNTPPALLALLIAAGPSSSSRWRRGSRADPSSPISRPGCACRSRRFSSYSR